MSIIGTDGNEILIEDILSDDGIDFSHINMIQETGDEDTNLEDLGLLVDLSDELDAEIDIAQYLD